MWCYYASTNIYTNFMKKLETYFTLLLEYKLIPIVIGMILLSIWLWKSSDSDE
jgi:hypothetical protein